MILSVLLLVIGLCVLLYPAVSSRINEMHSSYAVQNLNTQMAKVQDQQLLEQLEKAQKYNALISGSELSEEQTATEILDDYNQILNFGNGIMGSVQIPKIDVNLPIYHGVSDGILSKAVGHLPQSAFPIGGEGNHAVLTGHTGLPSAELFTYLTELTQGDRFYICVADRTLCYQVDQIKVVLPYQTEDLAAVAGEDYCTLVTCTPYGVNSHRLLVRGERVSEEETAEVAVQPEETEKGFPTDLIGAAVFVLAGLTAIVLLAARLLPGKRRE